MEGKIFVAVESFGLEIDGVPHTISKDVTRVREGHPILEGREHLFKELEVQYDIEDTTAKPGRRRGDAATEEVEAERKKAEAKKAKAAAAKKAKSKKG